MIRPRPQRTLESFGFTNSRPRFQPWEPSPSTPEIPLNWLIRRPWIAWQFARRNYMFSNAPIPALLHTCTESRLTLINMGYRLAFRTRSSGPRTWFNFDRDTLLLGPDPLVDQSSSFYDRMPDNDMSWVLNGESMWDMSQFDPREMRQVQRLALMGSADSLFMFNHDEGHFFDNGLGELSSVLRLFSGVEELLLVDWVAGDLTRTIAKDEPGTEHQRRHAYDTHALWRCIDLSEVDGLLHLFSPEQPCAPFTSANMPNNCLLSDHKKAHGNDANYFGDTQDGIRSLLRQHMDHLISAEATEIVVPWKIPQLRAVHVLSPLGYRILSQERLKVAQHICNLQEEWGSIVRARMEKSLPHSEWKRVKRVFEETNWPENHRDNANDGNWSDRMQRKWWIQEGPAPDVGDLLL